MIATGRTRVMSDVRIRKYVQHTVHSNKKDSMKRRQLEGVLCRMMDKQHNWT